MLSSFWVASTKRDRRPEADLYCREGHLPGLFLRLEHAQPYERRDRHEREHDRRSIGADVVEVLVRLLDSQRHRLRLAHDAAGDHADGAELPEGARGREDDAVRDRPTDGREGDAPEGLQSRG